MNLVVSLENAKTADLTAQGEIFLAPSAKHQMPLVTDVIASAGKTSHFVLGPGEYEYKYYVSAGTGGFDIFIRGPGGVIATETEDTKYGYSGKVLPFKVP